MREKSTYAWTWGVIGVGVLPSIIVARNHAVDKKRDKDLWGWIMTACLSLGAIGMGAGMIWLFSPETAVTGWAQRFLLCGMVAAGTGLSVATWHKKAKDEYDRLRLWLMARPKVCDCPGLCLCREMFLKECKEHYNVNLFYYK